MSETDKLDKFTRLALWSSRIVGTPTAFVLATLSTIIWALSGPYFSYSDTWQLVINTGTTVLTFLIVFLVQHSQNRFERAINIKMDELIRVTEARNNLVGVEKLSEEQMKALECEFERIKEG